MNKKLPSIAVLRALVSAARHQNFRRAAAELALTESAVSRQIASLEHQIGVPLFIRHQRKVRLTEIGEIYANQVKQALARLESHTLDAMARSEMGATLELASHPTLCAEWLIPRLPSFMQAHPNITVNIATYADMFLLEGTRFDAAIYWGQPDWPGAQCSHLFGDWSVPVCHPDLMAGRRELSPRQLASLPLLHLESRRMDWQRWFDALTDRRINAVRGSSYGQYNLIISAARAKLGIALLPHLIAQKYLDEGLLACPCKRSFQEERAYYFIVPESKPAGPPVMRFREWLLAQAQAFSSESMAPRASPPS